MPSKEQENMDGDVLGGDADRIAAYIRDTANLMGLRDWFLVFSPDNPPLGPDYMGQCSVAPHRRVATIYLSTALRSGPEEMFQSTVVHELLHLHFVDVEYALESLPEVVGSTAASILTTAHKHALELGIDMVAYEWSKTLPSPSAWLAEQED